MQGIGNRELGSNGLGGSRVRYATDWLRVNPIHTLWIGA